MQTYNIRKHSSCCEESTTNPPSHYQLTRSRMRFGQPEYRDPPHQETQQSYTCRIRISTLGTCSHGQGYQGIPPRRLSTTSGHRRVYPTVPVTFSGLEKRIGIKRSEKFATEYNTFFTGPHCRYILVGASRRRIIEQYSWN